MLIQLKLLYLLSIIKLYNIECNLTKNGLIILSNDSIINSIYSGLLLAQAIVYNQLSHPIFGIKHPSLPKIIQSDTMRRFIGRLIN